MAELDGRVAIVTGAGSGIGAATARALGAAGASIAVADVNGSAADEVAAAIQKEGADAVAICVDVGVEDQVANMVQQTVNAFGRLDILHNNAAITNVDFLNRDRDIDKFDVDVWDQTMTVNLRGCMLGVKWAVPHMLERGSGVIINTSSGAGILGEFMRTAYGTSKAAIIGFTRNVASQYGKRGIRCVSVSPGAMLTPAMQTNLAPEVLEMMKRHHLLPRLGRPEDIADAVVFLASDRASFITGITLPVDGGITSHIATFADEWELAAEGRDRLGLSGK